MTEELPLRYPGGKRKFTDYVEQFVKANNVTNCRIVEPFAGSAAVSFGLLRREMISSALLVESDPLVTAFWKAALTDSRRMIDLILTWPINLDSWLVAREFLKLKEVPSNKEELLMAGFSYLFLNRTCYSGIATAGPIGGRSQSSSYSIDCRFNRKRLADLIESLAAFRRAITIIHGDGIAVLEGLSDDKNRTQSFVYADPPYYAQGPKLYRKHFGDDQHKHLARALRQLSIPWLLSYDDHEFVRALYEAILLKRVYFDYSIRVSRSSPEIVISNRVLPPIYVVDGQFSLQFEGPEYQGHAKAS